MLFIDLGFLIKIKFNGLFLVEFVIKNCQGELIKWKDVYLCLDNIATLKSDNVIRPESQWADNYLKLNETSEFCKTFFWVECIYKWFTG